MTGVSITAEGARSLMIRRRFAHPPERLLQAHLDPALLRHWLGSDSHPVDRCEVDPVPGGRFRHVWGGPQGFSAHGRFEEITAQRIVHVEVFEPDWTGGEARVITDFRAEAAGCLLEMQVIYASSAARESLGATGMADGMAGAFTRLEALL